jgi:hypothetical protein
MQKFKNIKFFKIEWDKVEKKKREVLFFSWELKISLSILQTKQLELDYKIIILNKKKNDFANFIAFGEVKLSSERVLDKKTKEKYFVFTFVVKPKFAVIFIEADLFGIDAEKQYILDLSEDLLIEAQNLRIEAQNLQIESFELSISKVQLQKKQDEFSNLTRLIRVEQAECEKKQKIWETYGLRQSK